MRIRAAVSRAGATLPAIEELTLEAPQAGELLIRMVATGICHTDLKQMDPRSALAPLPIVLGHEGAGFVEAVGPGVADFAPGDAVIMSVNACGSCSSCRDHLPGYCVESGSRNFGGRRPDGSTALSSASGQIHSHFFGQSSFADHAICAAASAVRVPADAPLALLAPLGCGIQTGMGSILNDFGVQPGQSIVIFGGGAVGLSAVIGARIAEAGAIVLVDPLAARRELAHELGATLTLCPATDDVGAALKDVLAGGVDFALDTSGVPGAIDQAIRALAPRGICGLLASPAGQAPIAFAPTPLILGGRTIRGIIQGSSDPRQFIPRMIEWHRSGALPLERLITHYRFDDVEKAFEDAHAGRVIKPVLLFDR